MPGSCTKARARRCSGSESSSSGSNRARPSWRNSVLSPAAGSMMTHHAKIMHEASLARWALAWEYHSLLVRPHTATHGGLLRVYTSRIYALGQSLLRAGCVGMCAFMNRCACLQLQLAS
jgi:hypothetical protein